MIQENPQKQIADNY